MIENESWQEYMFRTTLKSLTAVVLLLTSIAIFGVALGSVEWHWFSRILICAAGVGVYILGARMLNDE